VSADAILGLALLLAVGLACYWGNLTRGLKRQLFALHFNNPVSGLPNQNFLIKYYEDNKNQPGFKNYCVIYFEIDNFSDINQVFGHAFGNKLIGEFTLRMRLFIPPNAQFCQAGADQFILFLPRQLTPEEAEKLCHKIRNSLHIPFKVHGYTVRLRTNFGYGLFDAHTDSFKKILLQLEQMVKSGNNSADQKLLAYTEAFGAQQNIQLRLKNDLKSAVEAGQFVPYFQPIVNFATGQIEKAEMLIRWQHPELGFVKPVDFIPIAEQTGSILQIGKWCRNQAIQHSSHWRKTLHREIQISINKSPIELMDDGPDSSVGDFIDALRKADLPSDSFVFELTENSLVQDDLVSKNKIYEIIQAGIDLSIDDFGTGFSSIAYLNRFPIQFIKLDISFVRDLKADSSQEVICDHIIRMAHALGIKVIAEGIETPEQQEILKKLYCDYGQGYLYSPPISAEAFEEKFLKNTRTIDHFVAS
jgi:diguanylate cyclase (GGDEF)-like protein